MPPTEHRRLEGLVAPLALVVVLGLVAALLVLRPGSAPQEPSATRSATPSAAPSATPSATGTTTELGAARDEPHGTRERARLPRVEPLAPRLPEASCEATVPPVRLTVLGLNTVAAPTREAYDLDLLVSELRGFDADVMVLQEVARPTVLARRLGLDVAHDARTGATVLSSYRIDASGSAPLPGDGEETAGVLGVRIDVAGEPVDVYSSRLTATGGATRLAQAEALSQVAGAHELPTLIGGDLGAGPLSAPVAALAAAPMVDAWAEVGAGGGATVPADLPRSRHDYLLADGAFEPLAAELLRSDVASHLALRVTYDVTTTPACLPPGSVS